MLPAVVRAVVSATWGVLDWQDVAVGTLGVALLAVIGYCAGALLHRWLFSPLIGLAVLIALFLPDSPSRRPLGLFGPVRQYQTSTRFELTWATTVFGIIAMTCLTLALVHLVTWARRRKAAYQGPRDAVTWVGVVLALGVIAFVWRPELYTVDRPVPRACEAVDEVRVCLHAANEPARGEVTTATTALAQGGLAPLLTRVTDHAAAETDRPGPGEAFVDLDPGPYRERDLIQNLREGAAERISATVTADHCPFTQTTYGPGEVDPFQGSQALQLRALELAGFDRLAARAGEPIGAARKFFNSMDAAELTAWVQQHTEQINSCTITVPEAQP